MSHRNSWISALIALPGVCACVLALVGFFRKIISNGLPFRPGLSAGEHYTAVGTAYGDGFVTGFFLCFFLTLGVLSAAAILGRGSRPRLIGRKQEPPRPIAFPSTSA